MRYLENPPWADLVLSSRWDKLSSYVGSKHMPAKLIEIQGRMGFKDLGCGDWGCVYTTEDPKVVFKLTRDLEEVRFIAAAMRLGSWPAGIVRYYKVAGTPYDSYVETFGERMQVFAVTREAAYDPGLLESDLITFQMAMTIANIMGQISDVSVMIDRDPFHASKSIDLLWSRLPEIVDDLPEDKARLLLKDSLLERVPAKKISAFDREIQQADRALLALAEIYHMLNQAIKHYGKDEDTKPVVSVLKAWLYYLDKGMLLADVRAENMGIVRRGSKEIVAIIDPGSMIPVSKDMLSVEIDQA